MNSRTQEPHEVERRRVVCVHIFPSAADFGALASAAQKYLEEQGGGSEKKRAVANETLWEVVRARLCALGSPVWAMRLYQEGLPLCGREEDIVRASAGAGSLNFRLLEELIAGGARLEGTEDPLLLCEEYRALRDGGDPPPREDAPSPDLCRQIGMSKKRASFIARRIDETLQPGETGVLFIGAHHGMEALLPDDVELLYLLDDYCHDGGPLDGKGKESGDNMERATWLLLEREFSISIGKAELVTLTLSLERLETHRGGEQR